MNETPKTFEDAQEMFKSEKSKSQRETENKKKEKDIKTVEIPFCSHRIESKPPILPNEEEAKASASSDPPPPSSPIPCYKLELSQEERQAAEDILRELVEIRKEGKQQSDPILDTMIRSNKEDITSKPFNTCFSVIKLSSASMSLPSPVTSGAAAGIHFKELFNFEVNFSESKY